MSSDEEDRPTDNPESGSPPSYAVSKMIWRNPDVTNFMVQLDLYSQSIKASRIGSKRIRVRTDRESTRPAPVKLPRNWYNQAWLGSAPYHVLRALEIDEVDIPLVIPDEMLK